MIYLKNKVCLLLLLVVLDVQGQNFDTLKAISASGGHDSLKVLALIDIANHYRSGQIDSAVYYGEMALDLAESKNMQPFPEYENLALTRLGLIYGYSDTVKLKGIEYLKKALPYYQQQHDLEQLAYNYFCIGYFFASHLQENDSAVFYFTQATNLSDTLNTRYVSGSYNNGGLAMFHSGNYEGALDFYLKAVKMRKEVGSSYDIACSVLNVGMAYDKLGQFESAKRSYFEALEGFRSAGHVSNEAVSLKDIGDVLTAQDSLEKALEYYDAASVLFKKVENIYLLSDCFLNMSTIFMKLGEHEKALNFLIDAERNLPEDASYRFKAQVYAHLSKTSLALADSVYRDIPAKRFKTLNIGAVYGETARAYADTSESLEVKILALNPLVNIYDGLGMHEKALHYSRLLAENQEVSYKQVQSEAMARMSTKYETDRIQGENELLLASKRTQEARLKQQQYLIAAALLVVLLLLVTGMVVLNSRKRLKKANHTIQTALSEKETLLKEIHHRVKNNLQVVSSLLELQSRGIEDEKALSTFMEGQNRVKAMALIHQKLYQHENLATIDFQEYAQNLMSELAAIYPSASSVKTNVKSSGNTRFDIDTALPLGLILNELISNAYKYAFNDLEEGKLDVEIDEIGSGKYQLKVTDNGGGLPETLDLGKVKSLGLKLVRRLSKQLYGDVAYNTEQGAIFVINFTDTLHRRLT